MEWTIFKKKPNPFLIGIIGRTNAGKSSLINQLTNRKLAAVSKTVNTTRKSVTGWLKNQKNNWLLLDSPGVCQAKTVLDRILLKNLKAVIDHSSLIWLVIDVNETWKKDMLILEKILQKSEKKFLLIINKIDLVNKAILWNKITVLAAKLPKVEFIPISVKKKVNLAKLINVTEKNLLTIAETELTATKTNSEVQIDLIKEIIREKIIVQTKDELPHHSAVTIMDYQTKNTKIIVVGQIIVATENQKMIILGKNGQKIKMIRLASVKMLNQIFHKYINLSLEVKVIKNWYQKIDIIKKLGLIND